MSVYYSECVEFLREFLSQLDGSIDQDNLLLNMRITKEQYRHIFKVISDTIEERSKVDYLAHLKEEKIASLVGRLELLNDEIQNLESDEKAELKKASVAYNFNAIASEILSRKGD
jgi:hypothetical protein